MTTSFKAVLSISLFVIVMSLLSILFLKRTLDEPGKKAEKSIASPIQVSVFNGCGRPGLASLFAEKLRNDGFDVVNGQGENADSFDFDVSVVIDRKGLLDKAEAVRDALGIGEIIDQRSDDPYLIEDVAVVLGRDWNTLLKTKEGTDD